MREYQVVKNRDPGAEGRERQGQGKSRNPGWPFDLRLLLAFCLLTLSSVGIGGCVKKPPQPLVTPLARPAELSTEELYQLIQQRVDSFQTLRGIARIRLVSENERYRFTEVVVFKKPDLFRLETLGFLNQPALFVVSDGKSLALYSKRDNAYYSGIASQANLSKLTGLNLSPEDVVRVLSGNPPALEKVNSLWSLYLPDQKAYLLELISVNAQRRQLIRIDATTKTFSQMESFRLYDGSLILRVVWDEYRDAGGYAIPTRLVIDRPLEKTRVELTYQSFEVNQALDGDLFSFKPPGNARVHLLDNSQEEPLTRLAPFEEFKVPDGSE